MFHVLNCAFLIVVLIFQSLVLNTYIISYTWNWDLASYFWFLGDLFLAGLFVAMSVRAYSYLSEQKLLKKNEEKHSLTPVITIMLLPKSFYVLYALLSLGAKSSRKKHSWRSPSLLHGMGLLCHLPCHQGSLHIQVWNNQHTEISRHLWSSTIEVYHFVVNHCVHVISFCSPWFGERLSARPCHQVHVHKYGFRTARFRRFP